MAKQSQTNDEKPQGQQKPPGDEKPTATAKREATDVYTVTVPFSRFEGERGGVRFREGRGETNDPAVAEELAGLGYRVEPDPRPKTKKAEVSQ